jgi:hypothetical protein
MYNQPSMHNPNNKSFLICTNTKQRNKLVANLLCSGIRLSHLGASATRQNMVQMADDK